ncbi:MULTISPECIES: SDR family NAD(P)-dependent oxidoreductase [unclassified Microcella]|uniref:SDR family NAD(P)-dependent oxidoreductase n=1 Tax=unclassified Microcella TaxID=2630066 RepID=UPI0006F8FE04|nr:MULTISPECIES: SDR family NAD(P)-dependent oxidoreductase [unclassified Microcella]KQV25579.1 shikimate dehydrogenase [Yonghaparkia sp. Root332]KRF33611.1 shikimate dehydrogenase [Yonghaparkia sp. Soil809]
MAGRLHGRTIIVTGGASGIGAALCEGFAAEGANAVIADLNLEAGQALADRIGDSGGSALAVKVDITDRDQVRAGIAAAVERFGRLDAYFNNAGMNAPMKYLDITESNFELLMKVNVLGVLVGTQEAAKQFLEQGGGGKIVNTASIAGRQGFSSFAPYSAAKAAVISLTQSGARAFADQGITVNGFAPGVVATPLWDKLDRDLEAIGEAHNNFASMSSGILLGRPADPSDIVPTGIFLAGSDSDYITGQIIPIEGGMILV